MTKNAAEISLDPFIPLDKSWTIRMGILDLLHQSDTTVQFLESQARLNDDLRALLQASKVWNTSQQIPVGESGTLFRFLQYFSWKLSLNKQFIKSGTLPQRPITDDPEIVSWPQKRLLELDNGTSQWASAAALCGDSERLDSPPFKLAVTYKAIEHYQSQNPWVPRRDETIRTQALAFIDLIHTGSMQFRPEQAEDYCFARAFELITPEEGEQRWPNLRGHESDRIAEMEVVLEQANQDMEITSLDHRVVQAYALHQTAARKQLRVKHPRAVAKTWPAFWDFLQLVWDT